MLLLEQAKHAVVDISRERLNFQSMGSYGENFAELHARTSPKYGCSTATDLSQMRRKRLAAVAAEVVSSDRR